MNARIFSRTATLFVLLALFGVLLGPSAAAGSFLVPTGGETVTVTTLEDVSDFSGPQQVGDLPGPDGRVSFREAVTAVNSTAGPQTIAFAIPSSEFWLITNMALLRLEEGAFFLNDNETTIDFSTQTANIGDTNPNGAEVGIYGLEANAWGVAAIYVNGDNCVIKGLGNVYQRGYAVRFVGNNNRLIGSKVSGPLYSAVNIGSYMGSAPPTGNVVGSTNAGEGNSLSGVSINGPAENNVVIGNVVIGGVSVQGAPQYGVYARNNRIGGPTPAERNVISGAGYYGEEGFPVGNQVTVVDADGTIVEGNYIGTTLDGMSRYPQQIGPTGVEVRDARGTTIRNNVIAGMRVEGTNHYSGQIFGQAINVNAANFHTQDTLIHNNTIGLGADGVTPILTRSGIKVIPLIATKHAFGTVIRSNHIASVETVGIAVGSQENGILLSANSIHDCGGLGIDLHSGYFGGTGGVTANDAGDLDEGANGLQNFPVILSATTAGSEITLQGTLDTLPSESFTIEFFASTSGDTSGFGEGSTFLGSTTVTTNTAGHASFSATLQATVPAGQVATATAIRVSTSDTSEFSAWVAVTAEGFFVAPDAYTIAWGTRFEGTLDSLAQSDDLRMTIFGSVTGSRVDPNAQILVNGTSPVAQPSQLSFKLEAQSDLLPSGQVPQKIELFNYASGQWVQMDLRNATLEDSAVTVAISSNASQYVHPATKQMRARLTWSDATQLSRTQGVKVDQCRWWVK